MNFKELMFKENYYIALKEIKTSIPNGALSILLEGCKNETDLLLSKRVDKIHLTFPSYATYSVTFEDYDYHNRDGVFDGNAFRIYNYSSLLEQLKRGANLEQQQITRKKIYQHFSLSCMEHQLDVVSFDLPLIRFEKFGS